MSVPTHQSEKAVKTAYDQVADDYADAFASTEPELPVELAMVEHFVSLLPRGRSRVLDAGCGAGRMLPLLAGLGCQVVGMDLSQAMARRARQDHPTYPVQVAATSALPFHDASFDGVFLWYSTIHTSDDRLPDVFTEARRVLRDEGLLLVAFQVGRGTRDVGSAYRRLGHDIELRRHLRTPDQVVGMMIESGFTEVARLVRGRAAHERDDQAVLVARASDLRDLPQRCG